MLIKEVAERHNSNHCGQNNRKINMKKE